MTKTYRDLGSSVLQESQDRSNNNSFGDVTNEQPMKKPSRFRRMSMAVGLTKLSRSATVMSLSNSQRGTNKIQSLSSSSSFSSYNSAFKKNSTPGCCACCMCCVRTPTFDPFNPKKMTWDFLVAFLIFYSVIMIPYVIGFNIDPPETMVLFNWVVDFSFAVDMLFNFFTGFRVEGGSLIRDKYVIAIKYLRGWFVIDLFSTLPIDTIASAVLTSTNNDNGSSLDQQLRALKLIRGLRLLRLLKLARLFKLKKLGTTLTHVTFFGSSVLPIA